MKIKSQFNGKKTKQNLNLKNVHGRIDIRDFEHFVPTMHCNERQISASKPKLTDIKILNSSTLIFFSNNSSSFSSLAIVFPRLLPFNSTLVYSVLINDYRHIKQEQSSGTRGALQVKEKCEKSITIALLSSSFIPPHRS